MASIAAASTSLQARPCQLANAGNPVRCFSYGRSNLSFTLRQPRLSVSCAAKPETVEKVCAIVREQLAVDDTKKVIAESIFADLGATKKRKVMVGAAFAIFCCTKPLDNTYATYSVKTITSLFASIKVQKEADNVIVVMVIRSLFTLALYVKLKFG